MNPNKNETRGDEQLQTTGANGTRQTANAATDSGAAADPATSPSAIDELQRQVSALQQSLQSAEDRFLRSQAELENVRKRMRREMEDERRYACLPLLRELLSVVDNLTRALGAAQPGTAETAALLTGVKMVADELQNVLEKYHCRRIPAAGMPFDPNFHSAIGQIPSKEYAPGTVVQVVLEGYQLHDRVIRPAQVLIAAQPVESTSGDNPENTK